MSETQVQDPIQAAIAAATAAAKAAVANQATAVAPITTGTGAAPAVMPQRGPALKMDDMQGGLTVDSWLGVTEDGFKVGKDKSLVQDGIEVEIDLTAIQPCFAIKFGNPAQYFKTYDRMMEVRGGSWADAVARAQRADPNAREYRSADIPMTLLSDVMGGKKGEVVLLEAYSTLGYSTPTTGWGEWEKFWRTCAQAGLTNGRVKATLGYMKRTNAKSNTWGIVTFTLKADA